MTSTSRNLFERISVWPVAGAIITINVVLATWAKNILRLGFESAWPTLIGAIIAAALVTAILRAATGSWAKAGIASGLVALYVFYVPAIVKITGASAIVMSGMHLAAVGLLYLFWRALPKADDKFAAIASRLNLICLILLVWNVAPLVQDNIKLEQRRSAAVSTLPPMEGSAASNSPDVWHLIFDRYAADSTLLARYGYDNSDFSDALRQRGFVVSQDAFANYQRTGHSVASTMNGSMLDPMVPAMKSGQRDWVPIYRAMRDSEALRQFDRMDYRTVWAGSWWEPTRFSNIASESIQIRSRPQLTRLLIRDSALGFWKKRLSLPILDDREDQCLRSGEKFDALMKLASEDDRKLVLGHFLIPHPPFVLNADGSCKSLRTALKTSRRDNYVDQVRFVNDRVIKLVDAILAGPRPAIIVIHSDEGPWPEPYVGNEHGLGTDPVRVPWADLTPDQMHEKFAILMAVRSPDGKAPKIMPDSPVQIYPAILKEHFGSTQQLPESRHVVFKHKRKLYDFEDISDRLGVGQAENEMPVLAQNR